MSWSRKWRDYKYRFLPWILFNLRSELIRSQAKSHLPLKSAESYVQELTLLLSSLTLYDPNFNDHAKKDLISIHEENTKRLFHHSGFRLEVSVSEIPELSKTKSLGVFLTYGSVSTGQIVALYPGTIYQPNQPLFFQSLNNSYILRCHDGTL